jgi:transmembrane sensor
MVCVLAVVLAGGAGVHWVTSPKVYISHPGETETIALSDGSKILLDADSRIRVKLTGKGRRIWLDKGRAQFEVSHDARRPFSVVADGHAVVALGTQFTVDRVGRSVTVDLVEGRLAGFDAEAGFRAAAQERLAATANYTLVGGQRLQWRGNGEEATLASISVDDATAWTTGRLVFVDAPLRDAIETVNRYTANRLQIEDSVPGDVRVSGIYRAGDVNAFLLGVSTTTHLKTRRKAGVWIVQNPE